MLELRTSLAGFLLQQQRYREAEPLYVEVLAILLDTPEPDRDLDRVLTVLDEYAALLRATGRGDEAAEAEARARDIRGAVLTALDETSPCVLPVGARTRVPRRHPS